MPSHRRRTTERSEKLSTSLTSSSATPSSTTWFASLTFLYILVQLHHIPLHPCPNPLNFLVRTPTFLYSLVCTPNILLQPASSPVTLLYILVRTPHIATCFAPLTFLHILYRTLHIPLRPGTHSLIDTPSQSPRHRRKCSCVMVSQALTWRMAGSRRGLRSVCWRRSFKLSSARTRPRCWNASSRVSSRSRSRRSVSLPTFSCSHPVCLCSKTPRVHIPSQTSYRHASSSPSCDIVTVMRHRHRHASSSSSCVIVIAVSWLAGSDVLHGVQALRPRRSRFPQQAPHPKPRQSLRARPPGEEAGGGA